MVIGDTCLLLVLLTFLKQSKSTLLWPFSDKSSVQGDPAWCLTAVLLCGLRQTGSTLMVTGNKLTPVELSVQEDLACWFTAVLRCGLCQNMFELSLQYKCTHLWQPYFMLSTPHSASVCYIPQLKITFHDSQVY